MREPSPNYSSKQYERPNQPWVCGLTSEGHACPAGPNSGGHCPALGECAPVRDGDHWHCNRSALRGGMCAAGPTPDGACSRVNRCRPDRSLRSLRARFVLGCTLLAIGGVFLVMNGSWRDRAIAPGRLASPHAQLLARASADASCAACHAAGERSVAGWTASLVVGRGNRPSQTQLCLNCHGATISSDLAAAPHNLPADELQRITATRTSESQSILARLVSTSHSPNDRLACSACHREHHGPQFDLTAIGNTACQACHQQKYESFAVDHPDFGNWPYKRRTGIAFNHASHGSKHFAEKKQAFDCTACHMEDATHTVQLVANYEATCAACHDERIATSTSQGIPMLVMPMLDVDALRAGGHNIGQWPDAATGDFDGRLPPQMKLLLAADPAADQALRTLGDDFEFIDIDPDDPQQLAAAAALAKAIKQLFAELGSSGNTAVRERLAVVLARKVSDAEVDALAAGLSVDTLRGTSAWIPDGVQSDGARQDEKGSGFRVQEQAAASVNPITEPRALNPEPPLHPEPSFAPTGAWFRDDTTLSIRYRPAAHADPVLTSWLELLANVPDLQQKPVALAAFKELSQPIAAGLCVSCHSVEQTRTGKLAINWRAFDREAAARSFTKFSHGPHLVLPQLANCTACHAIDVRANTASPYADWDPERFASEFLPIAKHSCAACHTATAAGDACQLCHNYHVELPTSRFVKESGWGRGGGPPGSLPDGDTLQSARVSSEIEPALR